MKRIRAEGDPAGKPEEILTPMPLSMNDDRFRLYIKRVTLPVACLCFLCCQSCSDSESPKNKNGIKIEKKGFFRNERRYEKNNVWFTCRPIKGGRNYASLMVGTPNNPYNGNPPLFVKLPDGKCYNIATIAEADLTKQQSKKYMVFPKDVGGEICSDLNEGGVFPGDKPPQWPMGTKRIQFEGWRFWIKEGAVMSFKADTWDDEWSWPEIGRVPEKLYKFPLTQEEVIDVFGMPDIIREYLSE